MHSSNDTLIQIYLTHRFDTHKTVTVTTHDTKMLATRGSFSTRLTSSARAVTAA